MKKTLIAIFVALFVIVPALAFAWSGDTYNEYNEYNYEDNTYNNGGTGIGVGIGVGVADVDVDNTNLNVNTLSNRNTNTNINNVDNRDYNFNTNHQNQGQIQGQLQGQTQGQGQNQSVVNSNPINNSDTLTINTPSDFKGIRPLVSPSDMDFPRLPGRVESRLEPHNFWSVEDIVALGNAFRVGDIVAELSEKMELDTSKADMDAYMKVYVCADEVPGGIKRAGYVRALAKKADTDSLIMLYICLYRAHTMGGTGLLVVGEGWKDETRASGWGIGFHHSQAFMNTNERGSGVATGGTGYSAGKASNATYPWIRGIVLK